jgi:DNA-binding IscR family transcriptional regulator
MEGSLNIVDCVDTSDNSGCGSANCENCVTKTVWAKMYNSINEVVNNIRLSDLVNDYKSINKIDDVYFV